MKGFVVMTDHERIAICGMSGLFPGATDLDAFWHNILQLHDASSAVPPGRWPIDPCAKAPGNGRLAADQALGSRGYFINAPITADFSRLAIEPSLVAGLDPLFHLALRVASDAFFDSVWHKIDRSRTGIIAGNILLPTEGSSQLAREYLGATWVESLTNRKSPLPATDPREQFPAALPIAIAARALDLSGGSYALDAACASTLYALHFACQRLQSGEADAMIAGGVSRPDSLYTQSGFSQLGALSPSGRCRPFGAKADGLLVGEGGGMFLLKRLGDALAHGDRIYGVIAGIGLANDLKGGLVAPSSEGQLRAMRAAYTKGRLSPHDVQLIECHATGTPLGDRVEIASLLALWEHAPARNRCVLSGAKANVGHLLTASGAVSLVKVLLALRHKILPPTIQDSSGFPALKDSPFSLLREPDCWPQPAGGEPRRAAVSGFGFGGINAHLVVEEYLPRQWASTVAKRALPPPLPPLAVVGMALAGAAEHGTSGASQNAIPRDLHRWWGAEKSRWLKEMQGEAGPIHVQAITNIDVPLGRYRIPPLELAKMSPQQLLFLDVAFRALCDAGLKDGEKEHGAVFVGVGLDAQASHFYCRWRMPELPRSPKGDAQTDAAHEEQLKDSLWPPLDAERTLGNLGAMTASRVVREFRFGGMGLTIAADELSGVVALDAARRAIAAGDMTLALVGAVDFAASLGHAVSLTRIRRALGDKEGQNGCFGDGAVAMVVMDAARAVAEGRPIYATIEDIALDRSNKEDPAPCTHQKLTFGAASALMTLADRFLAPGAAGAPQEASLQYSAPNGSRAAISFTPTGRLPTARISNESKKMADGAKQAFEVGASSFSMRSTIAGAILGVGDRHEAQQNAALSRLTEAIQGFASWRAQTAAAHHTFLTQSIAAMGRWFTLAADPLLLQGSPAAESSLASSDAGLMGSRPHVAGTPEKGETAPIKPAPIKPSRCFDYAACLEFARGSIGSVLGPRFAAIDSHPTRVRLPDEPLLLCHRILDIEGEPLNLSSGRIITEHDILPSAFYLDDGLIPIGIAIEAGQADLFLSAWLGIDFKTEGMAKYRLLDAEVTFHSGLPSVGETIRYDIAIHQFFSQGDTRLFRFGFTAAVDGQPLLTMQGGIAGFFSDQQLDEGRGIVGGLARSALPTGRLLNFTEPLVPMARESYDETALDALRKGDYAGCFGEAFAGLSVDTAANKKLPSGMMRLVHRIVDLDPSAGRYKIGCIKGEADIHPDDWFLVSHFVDDMVMPGTLMYECCFQTLRVFLMRMGWVGSSAFLASQPIPGAASSLKCRGQVLATTRVVTYEIHLKEIGYNPDAYAMADALMYADGKLIVEITNMTLTHPGFTLDKASALWSSRLLRPGTLKDPELSAPPLALLEGAKIRAFANGQKPSEIFGEAYTKFDDGRHFVARLPMDPYLFMDRVVRAENMTPMVMKAEGLIETAFDLKGDEWFFAAEKSNNVPYCVINEIALQACGFLAAYMGSALAVKEPLYFRNLAGAGRLRRPLPREEGTITTKARCISIVKARDLILQRYDFQLLGRLGEEIYRGQTEFGFFTRESLAAQVGIRKRAFDLCATDGLKIAADSLLTHDAIAISPLLMIDEIVVFDPIGGRPGLGYIKGRKKVDPDEWFFKAHFFQDPVMPGSLGLEGFVQLLKVYALERLRSSRFAMSPLRLTMASGVQHSWLYRGQVLPTAKLVEWEMQIHEVDEELGRITAGGMLWVDGLCIYQVKDFCIMVVEPALKEPC